MILTTPKNIYDKNIIIIIIIIIIIYYYYYVKVWIIIIYYYVIWKHFKSFKNEKNYKRISYNAFEYHILTKFIPNNSTCINNILEILAFTYVLKFCNINIVVDIKTCKTKHANYTCCDSC